MKPGLTWRLIVTAVAFAAAWSTSSVYNIIRGPVEASVAVQQVNDDLVGYAATQALNAGYVQTIGNIVFVVIVAAIWLPFAVRALRTPVK